MERDTAWCQLPDDSPNTTGRLAHHTENDDPAAYPALKRKAAVMSLREQLEKFADSLTMAITDAPDNYLLSTYGYEGVYEHHMADLKELWASIRPKLKRDLEQAVFVDAKLQEMFTAFDASEKERGRDIALALYNSDVTKLR